MGTKSAHPPASGGPCKHQAKSDKMYMNKDDTRIKQQNKSANLINQDMSSGLKKTQKLPLQLIKQSVMKTSVVVEG